MRRFAAESRRTLRLAGAAALSFAVLSLMPQTLLSRETRVHLVQQILVDAKQVQSAADVTLIRGSTVSHGLRRGETLFDGTRIDVPSHVLVVIVSSGGKSTTTLEPGASVTFVTTGSGELVTSNAGTSLFNIVPKTLDFFRVQSSEVLTASVHGTEFSIDTAPEAVTFNCTKGEVHITKTGYLLIGHRRLQTSLIDVISAAAAPQITYHPRPNWALATFSNFAQAEAFYRAQLKATLHTGDRSAANAARINLGNVLRLEGRYSDALDTYGQALDSYRRADDRDGEARALIGIGGTLLFAGRPHAADSFLEALRLFQGAGNVDGEADALKNLGLLDINAARYADALRYHRESLALYREANDRAGEARELHNIGIVERALYQYSEALQSFRQALAVYRSLGDRDGEITIVVTIALTQYDQGNYHDAAGSFRSAAAIADKLGDRFLVATAMTGLGGVEEREGRYDEALGSSQSAMATYHEIKADNYEAFPLAVVGAVEERERRYADSLSSLERARALFEKLGSQEEEALETLVNIAAVETATGHDAQALRLLNDVRSRSAVLGNRVAGALAADGIGVIHMHLGQYVQALTLEHEALATFRSVRDPYHEAEVLVDLGDVFSRQARYAQALDSYEEALTIYRKIGAAGDEKETRDRVTRTRPFVVLLTR